MKRRNVLLGLGASAAGSGIVFGTGAFTQVEAERSLTIGVSEDDSALLALDAGDAASVYNSDNSSGTGEIVIDTNELSDNSAGFNTGAEVQIGETVDDNGNTVDFVSPDSIDSKVTNTDDDFAFKLKNNFKNVPGGDSNSDEVNVTIDTSQIEAGGDGDSDGTLDASLYFIGTLYNSGGEAQDTQVVERSDGTTESKTYIMSHDENIYFVIYLDIDSTADPDDFTGSVTISAEPKPA